MFSLIKIQAADNTSVVCRSSFLFGVSVSLLSDDVMISLVSSTFSSALGVSVQLSFLSILFIEIGYCRKVVFVQCFSKILSRVIPVLNRGSRIRQHTRPYRKRFLSVADREHMDLAQILCCHIPYCQVVQRCISIRSRLDLCSLSVHTVTVLACRLSFAIVEIHIQRVVRLKYC